MKKILLVNLSEITLFIVLLLTILSFFGCGLNPNPSSLKQYNVTIIKPTGEIYKKHLVFSTGLPHIIYNETGVCYWEYINNSWRIRRYPIGWLIESEIIAEKNEEHSNER